jgi:RNA polymerase sigma-70 factor (ECF subfamily)
MTTTLLDRTSFTDSVERHRRELHIHRFRMLGSFEESEDAVQAAMRAHRTADGAGGSSPTPAGERLEPA